MVGRGWVGIRASEQYYDARSSDSREFEKIT